VDEGGAFYDGEHCYCAICVARLMQKVRTAQRGGKGKTVGVVFQRGLTSAGSGAPQWLLYTVVAEAALAAILLVIYLMPVHVVLPESNAAVESEVKIKKLLVEAEAAIARGGAQSEKALAILKKADNLALGTPWAYLIKELAGKAAELSKEEARGEFIKVREKYDSLMAAGSFDLALAALDQYPEKFRKPDIPYWTGEIAELRGRAQLCREAVKALNEHLTRVAPLVASKEYDQAIEILRSFPTEYATTAAATEISDRIRDLSEQRDRWAEEQRKKDLAEAERLAKIEQIKKEKEERWRLAREAEKKRLEEEARLAEEARKREEEKKRAPEETPEPGPDQQEPAAKDESKEPWIDVELKPGYVKEFPFKTPLHTPRPKYYDLGRGAMGNLHLPYPHKGKISSFNITDQGESIAVDCDADGKPDKRLPRSGGVVLLKVSYEKDKEVPVAVEVHRDDDSGEIEYRRYGWVAGRFKGETIAVIDENSNSKYNEVKKDAIIVGKKAKAAAMLANIIKVKDDFYEIEVAEDGSKLRLREVKLETGKLSLTKGFNGKGDLTYAVVLGTLKTEGKPFVSFELSGEKRPVALPVGDYFIRYGEVTVPKRGSVGIWGGPETKNFEVKKGKTIAPKWGGPGRIEFKYTLHTDGNVGVSTAEMDVYGILGEEYYGLHPKLFMPRVQIMDEKGKVVMDKKFETTPEGDKFYSFKEPIGAGKKVKVRVVADTLFLGRCEGKWK
jgi:hypothetical protein